jgi:aldehyde:ferredoxin oxidoreductase
MGSKNLKAIAVRGTNPVEVERIDELVEFVNSLIIKFKEIPSFKVMSKYGPLSMVDPYHEFGLLVTRYWHEGLFKPFLKRELDVDTILSKVKVKDKACSSCPLNCSKICVSKEGKYAGTIVEGLDFEPFMSFGPLLYNDDLDTIMKCIEICDRMGMDAISTGNTIAFAMECYEKGIITSEEIGGLELDWGNSEVIVQLTESIGRREGFGDVLAEGVREASRKISRGAEKFAMHIKGLELPMYDPRAKSYGLAIAVADRGACHCQGEMHVYYARGVYKHRIISRDSLQEWPKIIKEIEDLGAVKDSFIFCRFFRDLYDEETISKLTPYLMGVEISIKELKLIGERIINLVRAFNVREGVSRKDDYPPDRFFIEPIPEGPAKGVILNKEEFETALDHYYELREWNHDGVPRNETLLKLGLHDVVNDSML